VGEFGRFELRICCDAQDCQFLPMGPTEGEPRMSIFRGSDRIDARRSAIDAGWKRHGSWPVMSGTRPAWICPECVQRLKVL